MGEQSGPRCHYRQERGRNTVTVGDPAARYSAKEIARDTIGPEYMTMLEQASHEKLSPGKLGTDAGVGKS